MLFANSIMRKTFAKEIEDVIGIEAMDAWEGKSRVVSLVMEIKVNVNTFKLKRSAPDTSSYARNIAMKYGITYEQMKEASAPSETST